MQTNSQPEDSKPQPSKYFPLTDQIKIRETSSKNLDLDMPIPELSLGLSKRRHMNKYKHSYGRRRKMYFYPISFHK